ncbi:hypothetical protein [Marinoscillum sp.]|uniref:hypothetical protein n=1 Tax=Marinoscillum sp. TaxID=2024838 RepID=UPI003BA9602C
MKGESKALILIHFLNDLHKYDFENQLGTEIRSMLPEDMDFFELDNFSDPITLNYASKLIKADQLWIIAAGEPDSPLGKTGSFLNQTIRHQQVTLLTLSDIKCIKPFLIRHEGRLVEKSELLDVLKR